MSDPITPDVSRVPFRILRPLQRTLAVMSKSALATITPMPVMLVAKVIEGEKISEKQLVNPTRAVLLGHTIGWYKLLKEVEAAVGAGAVQDSIQALRSELGWLETLANDVEKARNGTQRQGTDDTGTQSTRVHVGS